MAADSQRASGVLDWLTSVDEVLREDVAPKLDEISQRAQQQTDALEALAEASGSGPGLGGEFTEYPWEMSKDVPADTPKDTPKTEKREIAGPFELRSVIMGWPDGADNRVGAALKTDSGENLVPRNKQDNYIAANDFTYPFTIQRRFDNTTTLVAEYINNDTANSHFVNVIPSIRQLDQ